MYGNPQVMKQIPVWVVFGGTLKVTAQQIAGMLRGSFKLEGTQNIIEIVSVFWPNHSSLNRTETRQIWNQF